MNRTAKTMLPCLLLTVGAMAQEPGRPAADESQGSAIKGIVDRLKALEASSSSVTLRMSTEGVYPGGMSFRTQGSIRVLEGTHFHVRNEFQFGEGLTGASETVRTPEGVWILDRDPAFGEVYLVIPGDRNSELAGGTDAPGRPALLVQLDAASRLLGVDREVPGAFGNTARSPLGSALLEELDRAFSLEVGGAVQRNGEAGVRVEGALRQGGDAPAVPPLADRVELFVRDRDGALLEMTQYQGSQVLAKVSIDELVIGAEQARDSYRLDAKGRKPRDVREHPPAWAEIRRVLAEARDVRRGRLEQWMREHSASFDELEPALAALGWAPWELAEAVEGLMSERREREAQLRGWLTDEGIALSRLDAASAARAAAALDCTDAQVAVAAAGLRKAALRRWLDGKTTAAKDVDDAMVAAAAAELKFSEADVRAAVSAILAEAAAAEGR